MKQYKVVEVKVSEAEAKMNDMSKEGWEVVSTSIFHGATAFTKAGTTMFITFSKERR